jgi:hypothetical protein
MRRDLDAGALELANERLEVDQREDPGNLAAVDLAG